MRKDVQLDVKRRQDLTCLDLFLFSDRVPIFGCNTNLPINPKGYRIGLRVTGINPETSQVVSRFLSSESKLAMCYIFLVMKIIPIRRCYLYKGNQRKFKTP